MGLSQSSVYLYLGSKDRSYGIEGNHTVVVRRNTSKICQNFERVFFLIKYAKDPVRDLVHRNPYYDITICTGTDDYNKGKCVFRYYSYSEEEIIRIACVYYSFLKPDLPLIVSFLTRNYRVYRCTYNKLETQGYVYSYNFKTLTYEGGVKKKLQEEYKTRLGSRKLTFSLENNNNTNVSKQEFPLAKDNKFKKMIYMSACIDCKVYYSHLFQYNTQIDPKNITDPNNVTAPKNFIDRYFLKEVKDKSLDGIIVYYTASSNPPQNVSYLVQFIDSCDEKTQYVRRDKYSTYWHKEDLKYKSENDLINKLEHIKKKSDEEDLITYILDKKENYFCVKVEKDVPEKTKPDTHEGYTKYSHTPTITRVKFNIVYNLQTLKLESREFSRKIEVMDSYFLKNSKNVEDLIPFLVVFKFKPLFPLGLSLVAIKYISKTCGKTDEWKQITLTDTILNEKLEEIEKIDKFKKPKEGKKEKTEPKSFDELREDACKILDKAIPPSDVPSKPGHPPVPPGEPGIPAEKYELTTWQIIGITVGAIHLSCIVGGVSYGIYWYRTTIMLLT